LVEQPIRNRQVTGSSPVVGSILFNINKFSEAEAELHNNGLAISSSGARKSRMSG
jgi:hypothetical protein